MTKLDKVLATALIVSTIVLAASYLITGVNPLLSSMVV